MPMEVRVSEPRLLPDLIDSFLRNDCVAHRVGDDACSVVHVHAVDAAEAWLEVSFFVGAWQTRHEGVTASLSG
jgi:hypothetical protein